MKTILNIFKSDIRAITKYIFVLIIVIALGTLPSLYAWINIYANWDPYSETGNVEVALASRDLGIDLKDGRHVNSADEVIADVKDDEKIAYRPLDDPEEAVEGVQSGRFYAAIIFEDGFTYDMHHFEEAIGDRHPKITYYTNIKKNPVASKITDGVAESLLADINSKYLRSMLDQYFGDADDALDQLDTEEAVDTAIEQLIATRDAIHDYNSAIGQIKSTKGDVKQILKNAQKSLDKGQSKSDAKISKADKALDNAIKTIQSVLDTINSETGKLETAIDDLKQILEDSHGIDKEAALEQTDRVLTILENLRSMLPEDPQTTAGRVSADAMDMMISNAEHIKTLLKGDNPPESELISDAEALQQMLDDDLIPSLKLMLSDIEQALERTKSILNSAGDVLGDIEPVIGGAGSTLGSLDSTLGGMQATLGPLETKLDDIIAEVQSAKDSDKASVLAKLLGGDAQEYSSFFANLVEVEAHELYKPVSYGAAMTPFYSIIALWVGGVMLVTLMNCNVDRRKFPQITETQGFFGRYLIFFLIGQIQAAVIVAGDIFLLHCNPVHPWLMWLAASMTSMVFVALIYALTLAFGDIGRAAVIVIMMIQIAGSSGTYPIEILPGIFEKIFLFFPFPYAINAMREAICGMYKYDFIIYLAQLMVFFLCAVAIGVFIRKPFSGVKQFMYDKMKETEVM